MRKVKRIFKIIILSIIAFFVAVISGFWVYHSAVMKKRKYIIAQEIIKQFEMDKVYMEKEINDLLVTIYPDFATVRRFLIDYRLMTRSVDRKQYWIEGGAHANT